MAGVNEEALQEREAGPGAGESAVDRRLRGLGPVPEEVVVVAALHGRPDGGLQHEVGDQDENQDHDTHKKNHENQRLI